MSVVSQVEQAADELLAKLTLEYDILWSQVWIFNIFHHELALAVLYNLFFCLLVLLPFLNFSLLYSLFLFLIGIFEYILPFLIEYFPFSNWNIFLFLIGKFSFFQLQYFTFSNLNIIPYSNSNRLIRNCKRNIKKYFDSIMERRHSSSGAKH